MNIDELKKKRLSLNRDSEIIFKNMEGIKRNIESSKKDIEMTGDNIRLIKKDIEKTENNIKNIKSETYRVINVMHNTEEILNGIEKEFEKQTSLDKSDIKFLFIATALQCARIYIVNNLTDRTNAGKGNKNENRLYDFQNNILSNFDANKELLPGEYYAPLNQIITTKGVPYDVNRYLDYNYRLFKGSNHRFVTLGHDPVLGLIFGTTNILTNTITCIGENNKIITNHVVYELGFKNPRIGQYADTMLSLNNAIRRIDGDIDSVVAAIIKQIIHIGTDMYTTAGIQLPGTNLLLSNKNVEKLTKNISTGDVVKFGVSSGITEVINIIISVLHSLMYDENKYVSQDIYNIKTRKIILYSNLIATTSNIIWTANSMFHGGKNKIKNFDIAGLIVILNKLITDIEFKYQIKKEFVFGKFNDLIK